MKHDLAYVDSSHFGWYVDASYGVASVIVITMVVLSAAKYMKHRNRLAVLSSRDDAS